MFRCLRLGQQQADEADGIFGDPLFCQSTTAQPGHIAQQNAQIQLIGTAVSVEIDAITVHVKQLLQIVDASRYHAGTGNRQICHKGLCTALLVGQPAQGDDQIEFCDAGVCIIDIERLCRRSFSGEQYRSNLCDILPPQYSRRLACF